MDSFNNQDKIQDSDFGDFICIDDLALTNVGLGSDAKVYGFELNGSPYVLKVTDPGGSCPLSKQTEKRKPNYKTMAQQLKEFQPDTTTQIPRSITLSESKLVQPFLQNIGVEIDDGFLYWIEVRENVYSLEDAFYFQKLCENPDAVVGKTGSITLTERKKHIVESGNPLYADIARFTIQLCEHLLEVVDPNSDSFPVPDTHGRNPLGTYKNITTPHLSNFKFRLSNLNEIIAICIDPLAYYEMDYEQWKIQIKKIHKQLKDQI